MKLSIIIPSWNNLDYLKICLDSIKKNSKYEHEIIPHVNVGSDGTIDFLKKNKINYSYTQQNSGICKGMNLAAKKSKGKAKVLLFERGIGGNVFTTLIGDIDRNEGRAFNNTDMNYENAVYSIEDQRLAYNRQFTNQILNMPLRSYAPFGTYLLSAAANTTGAYMMTQAPSTPSSGFDNSYQKSFDWEADK